MDDLARYVYPPRDYQITCAEELFKGKRHLLKLTRGAGKTRICLMLKELIDCNSIEESLSLPVLITCGGNSLGVWADEIAKWYPEYSSVIVKTTADKRENLWKSVSTSERYNFYICTYETLWRDMKSGWIPLEWESIFADEAHKLRNRNTKAYEQFSRLISKYLVFVSGTFIRNGPQDIWTHLHMLDKKRRLFRSFWRYVKTWCFTEHTQYGQEIYGVRNAAQFRKEIRDRYVVTVPDDVVNAQMPDKIRQTIRVEMTPEQEQLYELADTQSVSFLSGGEILAIPNAAVKFIKLRQILVCPKLVDPGCNDFGGGLNAIFQSMYDNEENHTVIFTPFKKAFPFIREFLMMKGVDNDSIFEMSGGMSPNEMHRAIKGFERTRGVMLCTIKFAESYSLSTCNNAYFLHYEWQMDENEQAEDRIRRTDSHSNTATTYYVRYSGTVDDNVLSIVTAKYANTLRTLEYS